MPPYLMSGHWLPWLHSRPAFCAVSEEMDQQSPFKEGLYDEIIGYSTPLRPSCKFRRNHVSNSHLDLTSLPGVVIFVQAFGDMYLEESRTPHRELASAALSFLLSGFYGKGQI